jgi:hypothetical protein
MEPSGCGVLRATPGMATGAGLGSAAVSHAVVRPGGRLRPPRPPGGGGEGAKDRQAVDAGDGCGKTGLQPVLRRPPTSSSSVRAADRQGPSRGTGGAAESSRQRPFIRIDRLGGFRAQLPAARAIRSARDTLTVVQSELEPPPACKRCGQPAEVFLAEPDVVLCRSCARQLGETALDDES